MPVNVVGTYPPPPSLPPEVRFALVPAWPGVGVDSQGNVYCCRSHGRPRKADRGRVRLAKAWRHLVPRPNRRGYPTVRPGGRCVTVHKLVLLGFVGERPAGMECRHLNDNKLDCRLENLQWGTSKQNVADAHRNNRYRRGQQSAKARLHPWEVVFMRASSRFASQRELARTFGVSQTTVWEILHGRKWKYAR